jgi:release factor glutamine methyltransferase
MDSRAQAITRGVPVDEALQSAAIALTAAGCETPRLDAELLLADALGVSRERLLIEPRLLIAGESVRVFQAYVRRRSAQREPVAYILGRRHFRRLELEVDRRALIPRPETELLVEVGLALAHGARALDVGTGSGAIALALADERPDLRISASDVSEAALALARENAERLGLKVTFLRGDLLDLEPGAGQSLGGDPLDCVPGGGRFRRTGADHAFDAILSNPPYVPEGERARLTPEITRHEPADALFAGPDGLTVIRRLVAQAAARPAVKLLALEVGVGQASAVGGLMRKAGFFAVRCESDLAGIERVVVGERR